MTTYSCHGLFTDIILLSHVLISARSVLLSTIVIVKGPTPPGTGVIALAISFTSSYATSPFNFPFSSGVLPTSIITAPF